MPIKNNRAKSHKLPVPSYARFAANSALRRSPSRGDRSGRAGCTLRSPGWTDSCRANLEQLILRWSGSRLPVVFDFDNTLVCGDIGEAVLAMLSKTGRLGVENIPATLAPTFTSSKNTRVRLHSCRDIAEYYEAFLDPTAHGPRDTTPLANGYAWAAEILEGFSPLEIVETTRAAYELSRPGTEVLIEATPGGSAYPAPFFYPEMVELIGELLRHEFDLWIISASNLWSVRWMILKALNQLLRHRGIRKGFQPDHIIGISTLLSDNDGKLYKDVLLVKDNRAYASLLKPALRRYRLTSRLQFPVPTYSGKIACIFDAIGRAPLLAAGDSPGDLPMLSLAEHRLWIARGEKPTYQQKMVDRAKTTGVETWMVQPVSTTGGRGFIPKWDMAPASHNQPKGLAETRRILRQLPKQCYVDA